MKAVRRLAFLLLAAMLLCLTAAAQPVDYRAELEGFFGSGALDGVREEIPPQAEEFLSEQGIDDPLDATEALTPQALWQSVLAAGKRAVSAPLRVLAALMGVLLLCALVGVFSDTLEQSGLTRVFGAVASVFTAAVVLSPAMDCIRLVTETVAGFSDFITVFIPVFAGILTAAGQPMTGAAYNLFLFFMCQTASTLLSGVFVPLLCGSLALAAVSAAAPELRLSSVISGIRSFATWSLTLLLTVFIGLLSLQSAVAAGGDTVAVKTTRFFISSFIPVVGRTLSEAFSAAQGCVQLVKSTLGAAGVAITAATFLPVLIRVAVWYAALYLAGLAAEMLGAGGSERLLKAVAGTLGILMAVLLFYALLVIVSTTLIIVAFRGG